MKYFKKLREFSLTTLPVDLLMDIFCRLPIKSLRRFRCVSKFWASILLHPDFTRLFMTRPHGPRLFFTVKFDGQLLFYSSPQPQNSDNEDSFVVATRCNLYLPDYVPTDVCKSVCGLVLLQTYFDQGRNVRVICNPTTGEFITLPKVRVKIKPDVFVYEMYLGYDPIGQQFKVLFMTSSFIDRSPITYWVLTLKAGKRSWKRIKPEFYFHPTQYETPEICINGVLYFDGAFGPKQSPMIIAFDVRSEKFSFINLPGDMALESELGVDGRPKDSLTLFNYKGKLGVDQRPNDFFREPVLWWVLENVEKHTWSKLIPKLPEMEYDEFVGMTRTGEYAWWLYGKLCLFSLERKTCSKVVIPNIDGFRCRPTTYLDYVENINFI